jgi:endonuclease/exonuclease/phosphatase family metal-dependent hydrolase
MEMGKFSLLSLNTFGLPFFLGWGRLRRLARLLDNSSTSVICLQEVQQNSYVNLLDRGLKSYQNFVHQTARFNPMGGLVLFSRDPIISHEFEIYRDRGTWNSISYADYLLQKGMLSVRFSVDELPIIVINTHMNANYNGVWNQAYRLSKIILSQVRQLNEYIAKLPKEALIFICGDLNFPKTSFLYEELVVPHNLFDPLADDERPTYRPLPLVPAKWKTSLDYAVIRKPAGKEFRAQADIWAIEDTTKITGISRFLTDHNAITLHVEWEPVPIQVNGV